MYIVFESPLYQQICSNFFDVNHNIFLEQEDIDNNSQDTNSIESAPEDSIDKTLTDIINPTSKADAEKIEQIKQAVGATSTTNNVSELSPEEIDAAQTQEFEDNDTERLAQKTEALKLYYLYKDLSELKYNLRNNKNYIKDSEELDNIEYFLNFVLDFYETFDYPTITNLILLIQKSILKLR